MLNLFQHPASAGRGAPRFAGMLNPLQQDACIEVVSDAIIPERRLP
jgi:hypothetical protein